MQLGDVISLGFRENKFFQRQRGTIRNDSAPDRKKVASRHAPVSAAFFLRHAPSKNRRCVFPDKLGSLGEAANSFDGEDCRFVFHG